ncbi:hypothetical protein NDU88_002096 [Pleurodeles waltl]|uniref:Uncharacterized protein n=1 Tax=Pleurodeles waltl TaxID=8319 RepID=A0AAV7LD81_PLEWA|nr:hypothetical protein NDU88_002096 [Pleurodeles waltl]
MGFILRSNSVKEKARLEARKCTGFISIHGAPRVQGPRESTTRRHRGPGRCRLGCRRTVSLLEAQQSRNSLSPRSGQLGGAKSGGPGSGVESCGPLDQGPLPWHRPVPQDSGELLAPEALPRHPRGTNFSAAGPILVFVLRASGCWLPVPQPYAPVGDLADPSFPRLVTDQFRPSEERACRLRASGVLPRPPGSSHPPLLSSYRVGVPPLRLAFTFFHAPWSPSGFTAQSRRARPLSQGPHALPAPPGTPGAAPSNSSAMIPGRWARYPPFRGHRTVFCASVSSTAAAVVSHCPGVVGTAQLSRRIIHRRHSDASGGL